jgi:3D (Asp-Asp-Asp) domain-containing protein
MKTNPRLLTDIRVRCRKQEVKARRQAKRSSLGNGIALFFLAILMVFTIYAVIEVFNTRVTYAATEPDHKIIVAVVTAYTSSVDETDENPFETASGSRTRRGVLACPKKYEFGTKIVIDGRQYTCEDRMNRRYRDKECFDIWVETKSEAFNWGRRELKVKVLS